MGQPSKGITSKLHYLQKEWICSENMAVGHKNIQRPALVEAGKILLSLLDIKQGLMKNFAKAINQSIKSNFPLIEKKDNPPDTDSLTVKAVGESKYWRTLINAKTQTPQEYVAGEALLLEDPGFRYLHDKFPQLSEAKINEGVFVGPQIRELFKDDQFNN